MIMRYPGGKSKLKKEILFYLLKKSENIKNIDYREPFFGMGSIGISLLKQNNKIKDFWINDKDYAIYCIWFSIFNHCEDLKNKIKEYVPKVSDFYEIKNILLDLDSIKQMDIVDVAFKKIMIHQISFSGLGILAGSPIGGREQKSKYKIDCRWSPNTIIKNIEKVLNIFKNVENLKITNNDFTCCFDNIKENTIIYLDPPYYEKGNFLYKEKFSNEEHKKLSEILNNKKNWVLSYDDHPQIIKYYKDFNIKEIDAKYSICGSQNKKEILIYD